MFFFHHLYSTVDHACSFKFNEWKNFLDKCVLIKLVEVTTSRVHLTKDNTSIIKFKSSNLRCITYNDKHKHNLLFTSYNLINYRK